MPLPGSAGFQPAKEQTGRQGTHPGLRPPLQGGELFFLSPPWRERGNVSRICWTGGGHASSLCRASGGVGFLTERELGNHKGCPYQFPSLSPGRRGPNVAIKRSAAGPFPLPWWERARACPARDAGERGTARGRLPTRSCAAYVSGRRAAVGAIHALPLRSSPNKTTTSYAAHVQ